MPARLILASASPRRLELLERAGLSPLVSPSRLDEARRPGEPLLDHVARLARQKAEAARPKDDPEALVLAADTIVFIGSRLLDKPRGRDEALAHLRALSGREHAVATAFCLLDPRGHPRAEETVISRVWFRALSRLEMEAYADSGEGLDKAGAYGIQGSGAFLVDRIEGSYTNIIGLPLAEVLAALAAAGFGPAAAR